MSDRRARRPEQISTASFDDFCAMSCLNETEVWKMTKQRAIDSPLAGKYRRLLVIEVDPERETAGAAC